MGGKGPFVRTDKDARLAVDRKRERRMQSVIVIATSAGMLVLTLIWWIVEARFIWPALAVGAAMPVLLWALRRVDASLKTAGGSGVSAPEDQTPSPFERAVTVAFVIALLIILMWTAVRIF
jgi:hypothetical protein